MQPIIPDAIAAALPIVGEILTRALTDDRLKPWANALIAGVFLVLVAVACCWLAGNFTGDLTTSIGIVIAYCALLMRGSLAMLLQFFEAFGSPVANALFGPPTTSTPMPLPVKRPPTPLVIGSAPDVPTTSNTTTPTQPPL